MDQSQENPDNQPSSSNENPPSPRLMLTETQVMEILENMSDAFYSLDEEWRVTYVNRETEKFWQRSRQEVLGQKLWDLFPSVIGSISHQYLMRAARERQPQEFEYVSPIVDRWISVRVMPSGTGVCIYFQDISERKAQERAAQSNEVADSHLAAIVRSSGDAIVGMSPEGVIESWNLTAERMFGYSTRAAVGHTLALLTPLKYRLEQNESLARVRAGETVSYETVRMAKNGKLLNVILRMAPIRDGAGQVFGISATMIDITERKKNEEILAYQANLLEIATEAIIAFDPHERVTYWNPGAEQMYGRLASEVLGKNSEEILGRPDTPDEIERKLHRRTAFLRGETLRGEDMSLRVDGTPVWIEYNARAFFDAKGQVAGFVAVQRDITARKQAEAELRQLNETLERRVEERTEELTRTNRELDQFAYVASHDLKAPLRAIENLASWIQQDDGEKLSPASHEHLNKLQARAQRMNKLLDDLLAYSRAGRLRHAVEQVDLSALLADITEVLTPPPGFRVRLTKSATAPHLVITERVPLETVLRNLIENTIKHHPDPTRGETVVSMHAQSDWLEFSVRDNGAGIEEQFHKRIFEIFQTLQPRDQVEGSGVGLTIAKKLVETRGGVIDVTSQPGEGSTFHFTWPTS